MRVRRCIVFVVIWGALVVASLPGLSPELARSDESNALLDMVVDLLASPEREMRGLAFQQVREEMPGEAATKRFVEELPKLPVDVQSGLLGALGERGDPSARPAVVDMVKAEDASVRAAAVGALAKLGGADDVPLLAEQMTAPAETVQAAARHGLIRLQGTKINEALLATFATAAPDLRAALLDVLARRNAREAIPAVLEACRDDATTVRVAAIRAMRLLAGEGHAGALVEAVKDAQDDRERYQAKLALMVLCGRHRHQGAEAIIGGLDGANPDATVSLLEALARAGGDDALSAVAERLDDENEAVRDAAVRALAVWSDAAAAEHLLKIAAATDNMRHHVVAVRGLAMMAQPLPERAADIEILGKALELARRDEEKRMILGFAGASGDPAALDVILPAMDDPELAAAAGLAAVLIAEQREAEAAAIREALQKTIDMTQDNQLRARARKVLEAN